MTTAQPGMILHVVGGECGEYSDHRVWTVAAYLDRESAKRHAQLAREWSENRRARLTDLENDGHEYDDTWEAACNESNPFDPFGAALDSSWSVSILFVHLDPTQLLTESAVLTDAARAAGWIP